MNFKHDLAMMSKQEMEEAGIIVPSDWNDYKICMKYFELQQRWFDSSVSYNIFYSKQLLKKMRELSPKEQDAIKDIEHCLKNNIPITPYMSKDRYKTDVKRSDFLLKNWNIYHLHLEKGELGTKFTNENLLFFQADSNNIYMIDVKRHPRGNGWFDRELLDVVYDNWPWLLRYIPDTRVTIEISDENIHELLKDSVSFVNFRDGVLFPTNCGVASSGDSILAVQQADDYCDALDAWEKELASREDEIRCNYKEQCGQELKKKTLDFTLIIEDGYFVAYEEEEHIKIRMFAVTLSENKNIY
ncbi:MAG: hypothetical protein PUF12_00935 [Thermoflexaceae bacterium]|nr:hypothetical protein [Thermoflexaceae bacterium]